MAILTVIALAAVVVVEEDGSPRDMPMSVPRSRAVVVDGTIEEAEWRGSAVVKRRDGEMLLRHDGKYLYIGIRSTRRGFPSVCLSRGSSVRVMHASFALGEVTYAKRNATWRLGAPFEWEPPARAVSHRRSLSTRWLRRRAPRPRVRARAAYVPEEYLDTGETAVVSVVQEVEVSEAGRRGDRIEVASITWTTSTTSITSASDTPLAAPCPTARRSSTPRSS